MYLYIFERWEWGLGGVWGRRRRERDYEKIRESFVLRLGSNIDSMDRVRVLRGSI